MSKVLEIYSDAGCPSHLVAVMDDYSAKLCTSNLSELVGDVSATTLAIHIRSGRAKLLHAHNSSTVRAFNRRLRKEQKCQTQNL